MPLLTEAQEKKLLGSVLSAALSDQAVGTQVIDGAIVGTAQVTPPEPIPPIPLPEPPLLLARSSLMLIRLRPPTELNQPALWGHGATAEAGSTHQRLCVQLPHHAFTTSRKPATSRVLDCPTACQPFEWQPLFCALGIFNTNTWQPYACPSVQEQIETNLRNATDPRPC